MAELGELHDRVKAVEDKIDNHHIMITQIQTAQSEFKLDLAENTKVTQQVADNTGELVELFKGAKQVRKFLLWVATPIAGIIYLVDHFWKYLK